MHVPWPTRARRPLAALLLACVLPPLSAAPAPLTFSGAIRLAVENAPRLAAARSGAAAASEELARAGALPDPMLMLGVENVPIGGGDAFTLGADGMSMAMVGLTQEFPSSSERAARRSVAGTLLDEARAESSAAVLDVQRATAQAWIGSWAAQREQAMLLALQEQSALAVEATRARLSGGRGRASDVLAAEAERLALSNRLDALGARIAAARAELARWTGVPADALVTGAPGFTRAPREEAAVLARLDATGELLVWDAREASAEARLALARAEKRPDWALSGGMASRGGGRSDVAFLQVSVQLPFFGRNRQDRGIAARRAELEAVQSAREDARRAQAAHVRSLFARWEALGAQAARYEEQILPLARDRTRTTLAAYAGGDPLQPWLDARRDDLAARVAYAQVLSEWGRTWAALAYLLPAEVAP